jgi:hypothetical protein
MLVGHYVEENGGILTYYDPNTNDTVFTNANVYLIGYWEDWVNEINWPENCTIVDPWRLIKNIKNVNIIHYGNTRKIK